MSKYYIVTYRRNQYGVLEHEARIVTFNNDLPTRDEIVNICEEHDCIILFMQKLCE